MSIQASEEEITNRLDLTIMRDYKDNKNFMRATRDRFNQTWKTDSNISHLIPSKQEKISKLQGVDDGKAVRNIVDYWFEAEVFASFAVAQAKDYMLAVQKVMDFHVECDVPVAGQGPILLETLHHVYSFSVTFSLINNLLKEFNYRKIILLHIHEPLDSRLIAIHGVLIKNAGVEFVAIRLKEGWIKELQQQVTSDSIIVYMGDMSPRAVGLPEKKGKRSNFLKLFADQESVMYVQTISSAPILSRLLQATHLVLDYPKREEACLRKWTKGTPLRCAIEDWVFWPALQTCYNEMDASPAMGEK
tara:strand:+ start:333 stop:1241 length:909 start_codon:yes stop_codon:yes gene_type:complete